MNSSIKLPYFQYIDTQLGLKYLNGNKKLYLKILKNFLNRYRDLNVTNLDDERFKDTLHTIKGLSATLGMVSLSNLAKIVHNNREKEMDFSKALLLVIDELQRGLKDDKLKTILIVDNIREDIDILVENLGSDYDVIVALDEIIALDIIQSENISIVLFDRDMSSKGKSTLYTTLKKRVIPTIFMLNNHQIEELSSIESLKYISKPFNINKLKNTISDFFGFKDIK